MKVFLDELFFANWMKVYLTPKTLKPKNPKTLNPHLWTLQPAFLLNIAGLRPAMFNKKAS